MTVDEMQAGPELDARVGKAFDFAPILSWAVMDADETALVVYFDSEPAADDWLAEKLRAYPDSWLKNYHVAVREKWPRFSEDIGATWQVVGKMLADDFWFSLNYLCGVLDDHEEPAWFARFRCVRGGTRGDHWAAVDSTPLAICRAALKALEAV